MRRWVVAAVAAAGEVAERPVLWLPAALAWIASVGWIPFLAAVARPPSVAELTFFGARMVTSGAWPWNAVLIVCLAAAAGLIAFGLVAGGNAVLIAQLEGRPASMADAARLLSVSLLAALPAAIAVALLAIAVAGVAQAEFNAPETGGGPILRTIAGVGPLLVIVALTAVAGAACAALAGRIAIRDGGSPIAGLRATPAAAARIGAAGVAAHAIATVVTAAAFVIVTGLLLRVLWAPIGAQLRGGGAFDAAIGLLLVGFVAIWLCLVIAGGALHAWSASTWSRLAAGAPQTYPRRT